MMIMCIRNLQAACFNKQKHIQISYKKTAVIEKTKHYSKKMINPIDNMVSISYNKIMENEQFDISFLFIYSNK